MTSDSPRQTEPAPPLDWSAKCLRLYNLIANLAHPKDDHRENPLEDEAHDILFEIRTELLRAARAVGAGDLITDMESIVRGPCSEQNPDLARRIQGWADRLRTLVREAVERR